MIKPIIHVRRLTTVPLAFTKHTPPPNTPLSNLPPLVFLHGLFGSRSNNRAVSRSLAARLGTPVLALDLRNHGESPHASPHDYPHMAADVEAFLAQHSLSPPILLGHSMGAKCAMAVALRGQTPLAGLVSIDNAPVDFTAGNTGFSKFGRYIAALQRIEASHAHSLKECDELLRSTESSVPIRQFLLTNMKPGADGTYKSRVPLSILAHDINNVSAWPYGPPLHWNGPSLFVRGTQSPYIADEFLPAIGQSFPAFQCEDLDAGHWVTAEKPREFVDVVVRWINSREW